MADTVGCGDSFAAAIVLGYIQQQPLETVLALANAVGAATATSCGAGRNVASVRVVRQLLQHQSVQAQGTVDLRYKRLQYKQDCIIALQASFPVPFNFVYHILQIVAHF